MCVAQLAATDGGDVVAAGSDGALTVRSSTRYFEIACRPQEHWTTVGQVPAHASSYGVVPGITDQVPR